MYTIIVITNIPKTRFLSFWFIERFPLSGQSCTRIRMLRLGPHQENQILDLEKIQKRAARFATGNHDRTHGSTARNLAILEWPTLKERRAKIKLKILHKAKLGITDIPLSDLISNSITTRRSSTDYRIPQSRLDSHKFSFYPSTIRLWNSLPPNLKNVTDSDSFSRALNKHHILG